MPVSGIEGQRPKATAECEPDEILRFHVCERHLHWAIAIPFKICYLTALVLVTVYNPAPTRHFRDVFAWTHRLSGLCLAILPPLMIFIHRREFRMHLRNIREAWSWKLDDIRWLLLMGPAAVSKRVTLPHQGKFNAAEKINFIVVMSTYPLYIATGLTIWFLRPAYVSWMIHFAMATLATPLVLGHIFMATVNPDTRVGLKGMITGWVSREWARHHYRYWYDAHFGHHDPAEDSKPAVEPVTSVPSDTGPPVVPASTVTPPVQAIPVTPRLPVPAAAANARPAAARPAAIVWPPGADGIDSPIAS